MGNCNFKADKDKESIAGTKYSNTYMSESLTSYNSYLKESLLVLICNWKGRFRESMESRIKERKRNICYERNVESESNDEKKCHFCHE
jgi:hypothetical protein